MARLVRIPGFFALLVEPIERRLPSPDAPVDIEVNGLTMRLDLRDYVQRRIYYGAHEPAEAALLRSVLQRGDTVLDVGANVGFFTLPAAAAVGPSGAVHAFEPIPANLRTLSENLRLNGLANVNVVAAGASNRDGELVLGIPEGIDADRGDTSANYSQDATQSPVTARAVKLDDYVTEHLAGRRLALVKIDVEGVEPLVLEGLASTLASDPPAAVLVEVNRDRLASHGFRLNDVSAPLRSAGYDLARIDSGGRLRPLVAADEKRAIFNIFGRRHLRRADPAAS